MTMDDLNRKKFHHMWEETVTAGQGFLVSGAAAGLSHIMHHPLYTLKSQMMYYGPEFRLKKFTTRAFQQPRGFLYRGLIARTIGIMPEKAFKMQGWTIVGRYFERNYPDANAMKWIVAGSIAGAATTLIGCPSERVMVQAQVQQKGFLYVVRTTGFRGLYHGWQATLYRDVSFNCFFFTSREIFVRSWRNRYGSDPSAGQRVLLGLPSGVIGSVLACPLDVVKTRVQGNEVGAAYRSCSRIIMDIIRKEGARHLMKGLLPRLIAVPSMMSWFYVINEEMERIFLNKSLS